MKWATRLNQPTKSVTDDEGGENRYYRQSRRRSRTRVIRNNGSHPCEALNLDHSLHNGPGGGNHPPPAALAGGHTRGETPVPIPNTAVKPAGPMILPQRESRSPPALNKSPRSERTGGFLLRGRVRENGAPQAPFRRASQIPAASSREAGVCSIRRNRLRPEARLPRRR